MKTIGTRVTLKPAHLSIQGTVAGYGTMLSKDGQRMNPMLIVTLDEGGYLPGETCFVSSLVVHEDNIVDE